MNAILKRINKIPGVRGTLIVNSDGLLVAADIAASGDANALAAVASRVAAALTGALARLQAGALERFVVNGDNGSMVLQTVGQTILLTLVNKGANMGMVLVELRNAAADLAAAIAGKKS
ncbi:MAG: roadblock/LC7 domain-containing protein [Planctomycetota bacterium]|nr:roadblock/LC7 domain-containing protein [Planctomycetota bacterium]